MYSIFTIILFNVTDLTALVSNTSKMNLPYARELIQSRIQSIFHQHQSTSISYFLQKITTDILQEILFFLPVQDQICFALSCKYLYIHFHAILMTENIRLPELLPPETRPVLCRNVDIEQRPRIKLLRQLEDSHWKYCSECWSLHPQSLWRIPRSICPLILKLYCPPSYEPSHCMEYTGRVDICPCLTITLRDKLHLIETCKLARERIHYGREYYYNGILYHQSYGRLQRYLRHRCTFTDHPFAKVNVKTTMWVDEETLTFWVGSQYNFIYQEDSSKWLPSGLKTPWMCPHKNTAGWLRRFFREAGSGYSGYPKYSFPLSCHCLSPPSCRWNDSTVSNEPHFLKISVKRNLGNSEWPDRNWDRNCHH